MSLFDENSPWVTEDNRRFRPLSRTTPQSLNHKHAAMLPPGTLQGKTVLDLGCCIAATGYWVLHHGAAHYTGVEVQEEYARIGYKLLDAHGLSGRSTICQSDLTPWLEGQTRHGGKCEAVAGYDIVVLAGVLYGYIDPLYILRMASELASECVVVDTMYPTAQRDPNSAYVEIIPLQRMTLATHSDLLAGGAGSRISPAGQDAIMANYGFFAQRMGVEPIPDTHDAYNALIPNRMGGRFPLRYVTRYLRGGACARSVNECIAGGRVELVAHASLPGQIGAPALCSQVAQGTASRLIGIH